MGMVFNGDGKNKYTVQEHCDYMRAVPRGTIVYVFGLMFDAPQRHKPFKKIRNRIDGIMEVEGQDGKRTKFFFSDLTCDAMILLNKIENREVDLPF